MQHINARGRERRPAGFFRYNTKCAIGVVIVALAMAESAYLTSACAGSAAKRELGEKSSFVPPKRLAELRSTGSIATQYCSAARDAVAEARYAQQVDQLERLSKRADDRLALIEKRSTELKEWIAKRDRFIAAATKHLVEIYGAMRPEAASEQLVRLDAATAAAILSGLDVRAASAILNDMPPDKAARLAAVMASAARKDGRDNP